MLVPALDSHLSPVFSFGRQDSGHALDLFRILRDDPLFWVTPRTVVFRVLLSHSVIPVWKMKLWSQYCVTGIQNGVRDSEWCTSCFCRHAWKTSRFGFRLKCVKSTSTGTILIFQDFKTSCLVFTRDLPDQLWRKPVKLPVTVPVRIFSSWEPPLLFTLVKWRHKSA